MQRRKCIQCGKEFEVADSEFKFYKERGLAVPKRCKACRKKNKVNSTNRNNHKEIHKGMDENTDSNQRTKQESYALENAEKQQERLKVQSSPVPGNTKKSMDTLEKTTQQTKQNTKKKPKSFFWTVFTAVAVAILAIGGYSVDQVRDFLGVEHFIDHDKTVQDNSVDGELQESSKENEGQEENNQTWTDTDIQSSSIQYFFRKDEYLTEHFNKHGEEFSYETEEEYLAGANKVVKSKDALSKKEAEDDDIVYYLEETNELVILSPDGFIRTYFKPEKGKEYFDKQ